MSKRVSQHDLLNKFFTESKNLKCILHGVDVTLTYHGFIICFSSVPVAIPGLSYSLLLHN
jgi:hypothetical protein